MSSTANIQINILGNAHAKIQELSVKFSDLSKITNKLENGIKNVASSFNYIKWETIVQGTNSIVDQFTRNSQVFGDFEQSIADFSATTGITGKDLDSISKAASKVGKSSGLGATQATEAFKLLASQISVDKIGIDGLKELQKQTILLSQVMNINLANAANYVAAAINRFGLEAKDARRVVNALVAGVKYGTAGVLELAQAFKVVAVSAAATGVSVESTIGAIETLSKAGLKGAKAGIVLSNIMLKMKTILGMDISGKGFSKSLESLRSKLEDTAFLIKTFGSENVNAAQFLIKNSALFNEMTIKVTGAKVAIEQTGIKMQTLNYQMQHGKKGVNDFKIAVIEAISNISPYAGAVSQASLELFQMAPALVSGIELVKKMANAVRWLKQEENLKRIEMVASAIATRIKTALNLGLAAAQWVLAGAQRGLAVAQWALNAAMSANPIGVIVAAIALLTAGIVYAYKKVDWFRGALYAGWEMLKTFGESIFNLILLPFKTLWSIIKNVSMALFKLFTGDFSGAWNSIKALGSDVVDNAMAVINPWKGVGDRMASEYQKGVDEVNKKKSVVNDPKVSGADLDPTTGMIKNIPTDTTPDTSEDTKKTQETIVTGGKKQQVFNINIGEVKASERIIMNNLEEGLASIEEKINEVLVREVGGLTKVAVG